MLTGLRLKIVQGGHTNRYFNRWRGYTPSLHSIASIAGILPSSFKQYVRAIEAYLFIRRAVSTFVHLTVFDFALLQIGRYDLGRVAFGVASANVA